MSCTAVLTYILMIGAYQHEEPCVIPGTALGVNIKTAWCPCQYLNGPYLSDQSGEY